MLIEINYVRIYQMQNIRLVFNMYFDNRIEVESLEMVSSSSSSAMLRLSIEGQKPSLLPFTLYEVFLLYRKI